MMPLIQLDQVSKTFGNNRNRVHAIRDLSFSVEAGQIHGFLGPNGAGKSTTIRLLLRLMYPTSGQIRLFGTPIAEAHSIIARRIGAMVEGATFYPFLSGRDNLRVLARTNGTKDAQRIEYMLELVQLADNASRPVSTYSMGMKQRLGIASALLHNPDLIILDEPTNGLDPQGVQDMRILIRRLAHDLNKTIFMSSHLLYEIELLCDHVTIIERGQKLRSGPVKDLLSEQSIVHLEADPIENAETMLKALYSVSRADQALMIKAQRQQIPGIISRLQAENIAIYAIGEKRLSLEEYFLNIIHNGERQTGKPVPSHSEMSEQHG